MSHGPTTRNLCSAGVVVALTALSVIAMLPPSGCVVEEPPAFAFLRHDSIWEGELRNFVDRNGGLEQVGRLRMKISIAPSGVITQSTALFRADGTQTDYEGGATMRWEGKRLIWSGALTTDPNNSHLIQNHEFAGYVTARHIYVHEEYDDVSPEGRTEKRRHDLHYYFLAEKKLLMIGTAYVDGRLLVFTNNRLERTSVKSPAVRP